MDNKKPLTFLRGESPVTWRVLLYAAYSSHTACQFSSGRVGGRLATDRIDAPHLDKSWLSFSLINPKRSFVNG